MKFPAMLLNSIAIKHKLRFIRCRKRKKFNSSDWHFNLKSINIDICFNGTHDHFTTLETKK